MTIDEAYKIVSYLVDKYQGTYIAPDDFNMIINMAQHQYIESIVDGTGNINSNNRKSPAGLIVNSSVSDRLSKFYTEFFPSNVVAPVLGYIRQPNRMVWAYTGDLVYSASGGPSVIPTSGSAQPEWGDADMNEIIYIAIGLIGINLKDVDLVRAAQTIKNEGQ